MNVDTLVQSMTATTYDALKLAVETGKWPDGRCLTDEQRASCLQAVMLYQAKVESSDELFTVGANGRVVAKTRRELQQQFSEESPIVRFKQDDF